MTDNLAYHYLPPQYYSPSNVHVNIVPNMQRPDALQRKRPKYTRSKTGCLTCRVKKIKCDETKPSCMRCTHGQRECTWPEVVPSRKRSTKKDSLDDARPSTAGSSGVSDRSTPPVRDQSPSSKMSHDMNLSPYNSHRAPIEFFEYDAPHIDLLTRPLTGMNDAGYTTSHLPDHPSLMPGIYHPSRSNGFIQDDYSLVDNSHRHHSQPRAAAAHDYYNGRPPSGHWNQDQLLTTLDPLQPYFSSPQERNLIRHYCDHSVSFIMAAPSEMNPVVAANLPLVLSRPPGDLAGEALRMALLGVASIHQSFLLARSESTQYGAAQMLQLAQSFRMNSKQMLAKACTTVQGTRSDASLAASIAIALMDIFSGGRNWLKNMHLAKTLVNVRGGSEALLADSDNCVRSRTLLEILCVYDIFGCLACGQEPTVLKSAERWWHKHPDPRANSSFVEQVFGMSRPFILLLARVTVFIGRTLQQSNSRARITEVGDNDTHGGLSPQDECRALYDELENWTPPSEVTIRIHTGDNIYRRALQILLLRDVMKQPHADESVQQCAEKILSLTLECCKSRMAVDLLWPIIIAGSQLSQPGPLRDQVLEIFEAFRTQCCYETDTSQQIVLQVWERLDNGLPGPDWRTVMRDLDMNVLLL